MPYRIEGIDQWIVARELQMRPDDELLETVQILTLFAGGAMSAPNAFWIAHCVELLTGCPSVPIQVDRGGTEQAVKSIALARVT